jgi:hypothetical protein
LQQNEQTKTLLAYCTHNYDEFIFQIGMKNYVPIFYSI